MDEDSSSGLDLLGLKPIGEAVKGLTDASVKGAGRFLSSICLPAAEEFGLLLRDRVSAWRAMNAIKIAQKAEAKLGESMQGLQAHPRLVFGALENGSWSDDNVVQDTWAGLLASSCTHDGKDDSNFLILTLLRQLSACEVKILNAVCEKANKYVTSAGWPAADHVAISLEKLQVISGVSDAQRLDREIDHLRSLELLSAGSIWEQSGFERDSTNAKLAPTGVALHLYVRGQGFRGTPAEYWHLAKNEIHGKEHS